MENICLDTDILIDFLRNKKETVSFIETSELTKHLATTYINLFELYYGAMLSNASEQNMAAIEKLKEGLSILNLSNDSVKKAGKILAELEKEGKQIEFRDLLIGIVALTNGFEVKTNNIKHFERIKGLKLI